MELRLATALVTLVILLVYHYRDHAIFTRKVNYPSPKCIPVLGNLPALLRGTNDVNSFVVENSLKLGLPW